MKTYVVMANDFPNSVWGVKADAEKFCEDKREGQKPQIRHGFGPRIHWRVYEFEIKSLWQPMETAPMDRRVLLRCVNGLQTEIKIVEGWYVSFSDGGRKYWQPWEGTKNRRSTEGLVPISWMDVP